MMSSFRFEWNNGTGEAECYFAIEQNIL